MATELYVSIVLVRALAAELARRGIARSRLLEGTAYAVKALADARVAVPVQDWRELLRRSVWLTGDESLGLSMGSRLPENAFQLPIQLCLASRTLRDSMRMLQRYSPLIDNVSTFELLEEGQHAYFVYTSPPAFSPLPQFAAELVLSRAYLTARTTERGPGESSSEVWFSHSAPAYEALYADIFDCPVRFERPRNAIVFDRRRLDRPRPLADMAMLEILQDGAEAMLSELGTRNFVDRVRALLRYERHLGQVDKRRVAKALQVSTGEMRRRLLCANTTFSSLLDEARRELACYELSRSHASIKVLSEQLGFSEPSAFHRAFRRWLGCTPAQFRRSHAAESFAPGFDA